MNIKVYGKRFRSDPRVRVPNEVLGQVSGSEMTVFTILLWLDRKGRGVRTSVARLSGCTGLSTPTVHTALRKLEEKRLIAYFPGKTPYDPWTYRVLLRPGNDRYFILPLSCVERYTGNELLVFGQLSCCSNAHGVCYPSHRRVAAALHLAVNTVRVCLTNLKEKMALEMIPRRYKTTRARRSFAYSLLHGRGVSNFYMLVHKPTKERKDCRDKKEDEKTVETLNFSLCEEKPCKAARRILQKLRNLVFKSTETARRRGREICGKGRDRLFSFLSLRKE